MSMQLCACGAQAGYPHRADCPRPLFNASDSQFEQWEKEWLAKKEAMGVPSHITSDAERADKAKRNGDWSLYGHICASYPLGTERSKQFGDELIRLANECRAANPPAYFK